METKTYTVLATTQRLGKEGDTVTMTAPAAKYWLLAGVIAEAVTTAKKSK